MDTKPSLFPRNMERAARPRRGAPLILALAALAGVFLGVPPAAQSAVVTYLGAGDLDDKKSWSTQTIPTAVDEAVFNTGASFIAGTGDLNFGNIVWNNNSNADISLRGTGITRYLTLSGVPGGTAVAIAGGSGGDLLLMGANASSNTLRFEPGPGNSEVQIRLAADGNINVLNPGATLQISVPVTGAGSLVKAGNGTLTLAATNTFNGTATVKSGTLRAVAANALGSAAAVDVQGGSLLIGASNAINDQAGITAGNAKIQLAGTNTTERVGALTLTGNAVIDVKELQGANNALHFASSYLAQGWARNTSLAIWNWDFSGENRIFFGTDATGLSPSQLQQISFYSDFGNTFLGNALISNTGEITTVPEMETAAMALLLLLAALARCTLAPR